MGTECTRLGNHTAHSKGSSTLEVRQSSGEGRGATPEVWAAACKVTCEPAGPEGVPLWRPPLVFFAFGFTTVTQSNRRGPGSSHSGGPTARWSPLLYSLYRALLQVQGRTQPWRERKGKAAPGLPVAFALLSLASYTVPPPPQDCKIPKLGSWTGTPVSSPQKTPHIYLHRNHNHTPT